ncbi:hypothetical protein QZH41_011583 [Actinostola sp. cb2023]|nr:hypothetical protein QZH41_011583 [Actinostola sp. cb2023]
MAAVQTSMYKLPAFYNESSTVELSNCMYSMKSYHDNDVSENLCNGDHGGELSSLEQRQENILKDLENLQNEVNSFASKLGVSLPSKDIPNVFCAGLDLKEVLQSDNDSLVEFRRTFQDMWSHLYGSTLVTMAAIKGHAIAGGCVLSLACDLSIMASGYRIGLPELALGLYLAPWMSGTLIKAVGHHTAEKIIYTAQVFSAEKAADIGLVDSVVPVNEVIPTVHEEMTKRLSIAGGEYLTCLRRLRVRDSARYNSSLVSVNIKDEVAVMKLDRKPVNSFSLEFLEEINTSLEALEQNNDVRGLILSSGLPKVFSAGLDLIKEIHNPDRQRLATYWRAFRNMFMNLYGSRLITIGAVNGHAIAGGCILASACDYRIMASNFTIGLNETAAVSSIYSFIYSVCKNLINLIGYRDAEKSALLGITFPSDVALAKGLVDKVVPQEQVIIEAHEEIKRWLVISGKKNWCVVSSQTKYKKRKEGRKTQRRKCIFFLDVGRVLTKKNIRGDFLKEMRETTEQDIQGFVSYILQESTQKAVQEQIDRISKKPKK